MTVQERRQLSRLSFFAAFVVALVATPLDIFAFNERELGTAHGMPWLSRCGAAMTRSVTKAWARLLAFLRTPRGRLTLATAAILLAIVVSHTHGSQGHIFAAGLTLQELFQKKGELSEQAKAQLAAMGDAPRAEDEAKFEAIHADIEKINKRIDQYQKQEAVEKSLTESQGRRTEPTQPTMESRSTPSTQPRVVSRKSVDFLEGMRSWFLAGTDQERTPAMREAATRVGINLDQRQLRLQLPRVPLGAVINGGQGGYSGYRIRAEDIRDFEERNQDLESRAAMGTTSGAVGGYTVPNEVMRPLEVALLAFGGMRQVGTVIRTDSGASLPLPTSNDSSNEGAILTENTGASEVDIIFAQLTLDAYKYSSKYLLISVELLQDSAINVAEWIGRALGQRLGRITNRHFTTGTGSSQPNGMVTAAFAGVTAAAVAAVTYDEMVNLVHSVDPAYRDNGRFMFHDGGLKMLKKIKVLQYSGDTTGVPLWSPGLSPGQPDTILGYPYVVNQHMTTPATGVKSILFGDFSKYIIRDVRDITLLRLDERFAELHQVAFLAFSRNDGDLLDAGTHPVTYLVQA